MERIIRDYLASVGKADLVDTAPEIFSWITVHDSSTSYHGRHYHRNHAMTAVLYLDVSDKTVRLICFQAHWRRDDSPEPCCTLCTAWSNKRMLERLMI